MTDEEKDKILYDLYYVIKLQRPPVWLYKRTPLKSNYNIKEDNAMDYLKLQLPMFTAKRNIDH
jgi:hypothetical protein